MMKEAKHDFIHPMRVTLYMPRHASVRNQRTTVSLVASAGEPFPLSALRPAVSQHQRGYQTRGRQTCASRSSDPSHHPLMALASQKELRSSQQAHTALTRTHTRRSRENTIQSPPRLASVPETLAAWPS